MVCLASFSCLARDLSRPPLQIEGTKIANSLQARKIAMKAYMAKMDYKLSATAGVRDIDIIKLGYDVKDFGKKGDRIWEARITDLEELQATLWIHPVTEKIYFIHAPSSSIQVTNFFLTLEQMKLAREHSQNLELPGANIPNGNAAARIAQKAYVEKMQSLSTYEGSGQPKLVELGFEIKGFAKVGDAVWEVRFTNLNPKGHCSLRAILWVHAETKAVHFVCGSWSAEEKQEHKKQE